MMGRKLGGNDVRIGRWNVYPVQLKHMYDIIHSYYTRHVNMCNLDGRRGKTSHPLTTNPALVIENERIVDFINDFTVKMRDDNAEGHPYS